MKYKLLPRICEACDTTETHTDKNGYEKWHNHDGHSMCNRCYTHYVLHPVHNARRLRFRDKQIPVNENPRKGKCELCNRKIGDEYINKDGKLSIIKGTDIHHNSYHNDDPLKDTIELCDSCHNKQRENK